MHKNCDNDYMTNIFYGVDHVLISGTCCDPDMHSHLMKHLLVSIDDDIEVIIENKKIKCRAMFIQSSVNHTIINTGSRMLLFLFDENTAVSSQMDEKYLRDVNYFLPDEVICEHLVNEASKITDKIDKLDYYNVYRRIMGYLYIDLSRNDINDFRVAKVIAALKSREGIYEDEFNDLSNIVQLSTSRMCHLFKEKTGISLKSYLLYLKIAKTYRYLFSGLNITDACMKAGFSSPSHFAVANRKYFGMSARYENTLPINFIDFE